MTVKTNLSQLYETDEDLWLEYTVNLLKESRFNELDLGNLIEELEDLGNEKKRAVESLLEQIIRHILLLEYWTEEFEHNSNHWRAEIYSFRNQIDKRLTTNLRKYLAEERLNIYKKALGYVKRKTGFKLNLPEECPYSLDELLEIDD